MDEMRKEIERMGVDCTPIKKFPDASSGTAVVCVDENGENSIIVIPGTNEKLSPELIMENRELIRNSDIILLQMEIPWESSRYAIQLAHEMGKTVILNPAPATGELPNDILSMVDYLTPNETELSLLSGCSVSDFNSAVVAAETMIARGAKAILVTLGEKGAAWITAQEQVYYPAIRVQPVDTTAAGDTFNGAFAVAIAQGEDIPQAIHFAIAASALAVTRSGAQKSIPSRKETLEFEQMHFTARRKNK